MDYNQWMQGSPETIQEWPYEDNEAKLSTQSENSESEHMLINHRWSQLELARGHKKMVKLKNSQACLVT